MRVELIAVVATQNYMEATLRAIRKSLTNFDKFSDVTIICPQKETVPHEFTSKYVDFDYKDYSKFMLQELVKYVNYDYCLTIQYDSCVIDATMWNNDLLDYDVVGAVWPNQWINRVGNLGFSLRSERFLEATARLDYVGDKPTKEENAEDYFACVTNYHNLIKQGISFAPISLARQFSVEHPIAECPHDYDNLSTYKSFGFHSDWNRAGMRYINE